MMFGFFIGVMIAGYMYLHSKSIGFTFPNIDGVLSVRPTMARVAGYLAGRWIGFCLLGLLCGWLGDLFSTPLIQRFVYSISCLFILFFILFLLTNHSPDLFLAERINPKHLSLPVFIIGVISPIISVAPLWIACLIVVGKYPGFQGGVFFTYVFLGYALLSFPILLNMKWRQIPLLTKGLRLVLTALAVLLMAFILQEFLRI